MSKSSEYPPLRDIINQYGLRAEKKFGQNFLLDLNVTRKIVAAAKGVSSSHLVEIGPGPGGLTRAILEQDPASLSVIEIDPRCVQALEIYDKKINVFEQDALTVEIQKALPQAPRIIIGNLPYNVATPLLVKWLKDIYQNAGAYTQMVLMFQKEVADRIITQPHSKTYGRLSILSQWLCDIKKVMTLPPQAFTPPPKVHSTVLSFLPKAKRLEADFGAVENLTAKLFQARRKMLRQTLKFHTDILENLNIDPTLRPENLTVEQIVNLANHVSLVDK